MTRNTSVVPVVDQLRSREAFSGWINYLKGLAPRDVELLLPQGNELEAILRELAVPEDDIPAVIAARPDRDRSPGAWWLLERCAWSLLDHMGSLHHPPAFPVIPDDIEGLDQLFYVHVFVAVLPFVRDYYRSHAIPAEIARETLADLGRQLRVHRKRYGETGLCTASWLTLHFRGMIYQPGRLQFERARLRSGIAEALQERGVDCTPEDQVLAIHIPDFSGPMSPEACDASIARARVFFARHFPEERVDYAVCHSWLLDPQLLEYLPETSNIIRFQQRFALADRTDDADESILRFVFGPVPENLDALPQRSTLERGIVAHRKAGRHWRGRSGWFAWK